MCMVDEILFSGSPRMMSRGFDSLKLLGAVVKIERQRPCVETESGSGVFWNFCPCELKVLEIYDTLEKTIAPAPSRAEAISCKKVRNGQSSVCYDAFESV